MNDIKEISTDICILGGGPAGYVAAIRVSQLGGKVVLIEEREIGGTCLNRGCIPTKSLLKTSEALYLLKKVNELGIESSISAIDHNIIVSRKDRVVKSLRMGLEHLLSKDGVEILKGRGWIETPGKIRVKTKNEEIVVCSNKLIITTGSEPLLPNLPGINLDGVITSDEALDMKNVPESITIIGAGAIGMEFATLFNSLGTKVTVVEFKDTILPGEDREVTAELLKIMKRQGIKFKLTSKVKEISKVDKGLDIIIDENGNERTIQSEKVLVAAGRKLNSLSPDIVSLGLKKTNGSIEVNERMETNLEGVYAAGDVIGGSLLAHLAFAEGRVAAENAMGIQSRLNYNTVPSCIYTIPEVASVGLSEDQAKEQGITVRVGRFDFRNNGRALCHGDREGFVKVITEESTGVILGARILGPHASELLSEITLAVTLGVKAEVLADMIHPHPSLSEAVMEACADAIGRAIHK